MDYTNLLNRAKDSFKVADIEINSDVLVGDLQKHFKNSFSLTLRIYKGEEGLAEPIELLGDISEGEIRPSRKPFKIKASWKIRDVIKSFEENYSIITEIGNGDDTHVVPEDTTLGDAARGKYPKDNLVDESLKNSLIDLAINKRGFKDLRLFYLLLARKKTLTKEDLLKEEITQGTRLSESTVNKIIELTSRKDFDFTNKMFLLKGPDKFELKAEYYKFMAQVNYEIRKTLHARATSIGNYDMGTLRQRFQEDLNDSGNLSPRLVVFFILLLGATKPLTREEIKKAFVKHGVSEDEGRAGTHLSNVSQYLTRPENDHVRQVIGWSVVRSDKEKAQNVYYKDEFIIRSNDYKKFLKELIDELNNS